MAKGITKLQALLKKKGDEMTKLQNEINVIEKGNSSHRDS